MVPSSQPEQQAVVLLCLKTQPETKGEEWDPENEDLGGLRSRTGARCRTRVVDPYLEPLTPLFPRWKTAVVVILMLVQGFRWKKPF